MPSAPVPQKRSRTLAPPTSPRIANSASRTRSAVGRTAAERRGGAARRRPLSSPATTLIHRRLRAAPSVTPVCPRPARRRSAPGRPASSGPSSGASSDPYRSSSSISSRRASVSTATSSGSSATRKRGRPCCRVPRISPSPRSARSTSASLKPSRSASIAARRRRASSEPASREQDAVRGMLAAPHPAAKLMELGEPVALRSLDQHHGRVGDVDPHLDHARRHQHVGPPGGEPLHRGLLVAGRHLPVQQADLEVGELAGAQPVGLLGRGLRLELLRALDQRTDDVRLAALAQPLADELVGAGPLLLPHHPGLDRPAPRRQLAKDGGVEIAVGGQRQGPRDRRRGHVEDVRRRPSGPLGVERGALADAEAMLLVDDADREPVEGDVGLDQRVRPDHHPELAGGEPAERLAAPRRRRRAGQQREGDRVIRQQPVQRRGVLLGERLGRRHQRRLEAGLDRAKHRVRRDHRLPGSRPLPSAGAAWGARTRGRRRSPRSRAADRP